MKFEKWYEETWGSKSEDTDESNRAFYAWQACKVEVLKILKENLYNPRDFGPDDADTRDDYKAIDCDVIEQIEKL